MVAYVVAAFAMALAASCALILVTAVDHFDATEETPAAKPAPVSRTRGWTLPLITAHRPAGR